MWRTHVDVAVLADYKSRHLLRCQQHATLPLSIWNYSDSVQHTAGLWDHVTTMCRGLVINTDTGEIVARSFDKFWNDGEHKHDATPDYHVYEKLDGSLGILFYYDGQWIVSSRGAFESGQAYHAHDLLFGSGKYDVSTLDPTVTYVLEIIYAENRIVVNYGDRDELVLLAQFQRQADDWKEIHPMLPCTFPAVKEYDAKQPLSLYQQLDEDNKEGFVVRFSNGQRMKIKFASYKELHRIHSNLSSATVFEAFRNKSSLEDVLACVPDEFHEWIRSEWAALVLQHDALRDQIVADMHRLMDGKEHEELTQKDFALLVAKHPHKGEMFQLRRGAPIFYALCKHMSANSDSTSSAQTTVKMSSAAPTRTAAPTPMPARPPPVARLKLLIGISGSGKSTRAKEIVRSRGTDLPTIIVSRDLLRQQLFAYDESSANQYYQDHRAYLGKSESLVTDAEYAQIDAALAQGYYVVVDDTNLAFQTIKGFILRYSHVSISYELLDTPLQVALENNKARRRVVDGAIVLKQHHKLKMLRKHLMQIDELISMHCPDGERERWCVDQFDCSDLPLAVVVDMDGTLCLHQGRSPFDWHRVHTDLVNAPVKEVVLALDDAGYAIVICTGRSQEARKASIDWLARHDIPVADFYIRKPSDQRPDFVVKEEMWKEILGKYKVLCMIDDREQVVRHCRRLGFTCLQVAEGAF